MNQKFEKSQKLEKWLRWMETIHNEILALVADANMFWEVQDIIRENPRIQKPNAFYSYLARTYLSHALVGLGRQMKLQKDSISFVRLLDEIAKNPEKLSSSYFNSRHPHFNGPDLDQVVGKASLEAVGIVDASQLQEIIKVDDFAPYAEASGTHVCPQMVEDDRKRLESAAKKHETFADKRIAHWDKRKPTVVPTFEALDDCIKLLDQTYVKYHFLFHAESIDTLMPTYQYEWKSIFCEPWLKVGFGSAKGLIHVGEGFDDELPDFKEYME
ncbi:MAG: hypothetical protein OXU27_00015 [Candidatus Poribacteria bacterium]|nr:hypothetical protein [Candidatus Poribacteria bacterium]